MTTLQDDSSSSSKRVRRITVLISGSGSNLQALLTASQTPALPRGQTTKVISSRSNAYGLTRAQTHSPSIPTSTCALKTFLSKNPGSNRENYDVEIARQVLDSRPDMVVLAGWMHILSDAFLDILNGVHPPPSAPALGPPDSEGATSRTEEVATSSRSGNDTARPTTGKGLPEPPYTQRFPIPIINLHPALPGAFDGANAIGRAFEAFQKGEVKKTGVMVHRVVREVDRGEPLVVRELEMREGETIEQLEGRIHEIEHEIIVEGARLVLEELDKEDDR